MLYPKIENLLQIFEFFLNGFDPTVLMYLDTSGNWKKNPKNLRDEISNELWYRIWESKQNNNYNEQVKNLICPFIQEEKIWCIINDIFNAISLCEKDALKNKNENANYLLIIFEIIYHLIEYDANKRIGEIYVPDWDYKEKAKKTKYIEKSDNILNKLCTPLSVSQEDKRDILFEIINQLKKNTDSIFNKVSAIISEQERISDNINELLIFIKDSKRKEETYDLIREQISPSANIITPKVQALLYPCLELISNTDIDISSGIQYGISITLGILKDLRSTDSLLKLLDVLDAKHTNLRHSIIYDIGNLEQRKSVDSLISVLNQTEEVKLISKDGFTYNQSLDLEKCEAIWALGKLKGDAIKSVPTLTKYANNPNREIKIYLAWAMGMIGKDQKEKYLGVDANIIITLLNLLTDKDVKVFEESAFALRSLDLPDFLHNLYLYNISTIPILSLKPSSTGLYELSETLLYLMSVKKPVVMAVTGDSGTGKTYFCQTIVNGFGEVKKEEILYLMRDNTADVKIFNRILGINCLKSGLIDPQYYQDYPLTEDEDNPDKFFEEFIKKCSNRKLIILDGWRDETYFQKVIDTFYTKGYLDIIVNFRTTYSTRRLNLEAREGSLESVRNHLSNIEKIAIEETGFYRDGSVITYNLDNSIPSRLSGEEILEVFQRKKIDDWNNYIRIGDFQKNIKPLTNIAEENLSTYCEDISFDIEPINQEEKISFVPNEINFTRILNDDIDSEPNLLQIIKTSNIIINHIAFYTQGQIAYCGYDGTVGVLTGFRDRILYYNVHKNKATKLTIAGNNICSIDDSGELKITSFNKNEITNLGLSDSLPCSIASHNGKIITGHLDGTIRIWDVESKRKKVLKGHSDAVLSIVIDHYGRIFSVGKDKELRIWDIKNNKVKLLKGHESAINSIGLYPVRTCRLQDSEVVTGTINGKIRIIDIETGRCKVLDIPNFTNINSITVYFDGRIIVGITNPNRKGTNPYTLAIIAPCYDPPQYKTFTGHRFETIDCITMGPRIITLGNDGGSVVDLSTVLNPPFDSPLIKGGYRGDSSESTILQHHHDGDTGQTLKIWGTELYVKAEYSKLNLMTDAKDKPAYYRSLF